MGFNPIKAITGSVGGLVGAALGGLGGKDKKSSAPAPAAASTTTADDVAKEEERRRLLSRGLSPLTATSPLGDTTAANLGRKALLGV